MKDPLYWVAIKYKLALTFILLALVSLGTGGVVAYYTAKNALLEQILGSLRVSTIARVGEVSAFLDSLQKRTEDFSSDGFIRDATRALQGDDPGLAAELNRHLLRNKVSIVSDFFETLVVGTHGKVLASSIPTNVGLDLSREPCFLKGEDRVFLGDIQGKKAKTSRPSLEISAPLTDRENGAFVGVIINRVKAESISRVVVGPSAAGSGNNPGPVPDDMDYYLIDADGVFLSGTRLVEFGEAFLKKKIPTPRTGSAAGETRYVDSGPSTATSGHRSRIEIRSGLRVGHQGAQVISAWSGVPGTGWTLVSEVEAGRAFQPVTVLRNRLGFVGMILAGMTALLLFFPSKFMIGPIQRLRDAALRIEKGEFNVTVPVNSNDEIGELANAFNQMAAGLQVRTQLEKRLYQHEKMMVIGELSAAFAHELNTPLASIAMFSQMLLDDAPEDSPLREHLEVILRNVRTCEETVRSLLGNTGKGSGERSAVDLNECLREVLALCRPLLEGYAIRHELNLAKNLPKCMGDRERLRQVFVNLTMNAIQAMEGGGTLAIRTRCVDSGGTESAVVEFRDTGDGIPDEQAVRIFEPFFTTKPEGVGTGLGLPIARRVIEEHGGHIDVAAPDSGGGNFIVTLPSQSSSLRSKHA